MDDIGTRWMQTLMQELIVLFVLQYNLLPSPHNNLQEAISSLKTIQNQECVYRLYIEYNHYVDTQHVEGGGDAG